MLSDTKLLGRLSAGGHFRYKQRFEEIGRGMTKIALRSELDLILVLFRFPSCLGSAQARPVRQALPASGHACGGRAAWPLRTQAEPGYEKNQEQKPWESVRENLSQYRQFSPAQTPCPSGHKDCSILGIVLFW